MEVVLPRGARRDVHNRTVVACVRRLETEGRIDQEVRTFATLTADLLKRADGLAAGGVTQVAREATGVSCKPVFHLLEPRLTLLVVNAQHIKQVPGRKTDGNDCPWLAQGLHLGGDGHGWAGALDLDPPAPDVDGGRHRDAEPDGLAQHQGMPHHLQEGGRGAPVRVGRLCARTLVDAHLLHRPQCVVPEARRQGWG